MIEKLWTAQYRYSGPDRVDITVKAQHPTWKRFAPTWDMVMGHKNGVLSDAQYTNLYLNILHSLPHDGWNPLLSMKEATLVCFCPATAFCHRHILAHHILTNLPFVEWCGERP